jgi:hypothetical protein
MSMKLLLFRWVFSRKFTINIYFFRLKNYAGYINNAQPCFAQINNDLKISILISH